MARPKLWMSWSSGKDSAFCLAQLLASREYQVTALLTTVTREYGRVSMHAVREELLEAQAERLGLKLVKIPIPAQCVNEDYERGMKAAMEQAASEGVTHVAFGDLYLADIRNYREEKLRGSPIAPVFPLWLKPTRELALAMIESGLKAVVTCVDPRRLPREFAGRKFDRAFLEELPSTVDPCGENGEFHTFVFDSPIFSSPIPVKIGEVVDREGFVFADVVPIAGPVAGVP